MSNEIAATNKKSIKWLVFLPPWIIMTAMIVVAFVNAEAFNTGLTAVTKWIVDSFAWLLNGITFTCIMLLAYIYFSPFAKVRIGGSQAKPITDYVNIFWIALCTTIATGLLFWATAEPIFHMIYPPNLIGGAAVANTSDAAVWAMKALYLERSFPPYSIYCTATVAFAFVFYNMRKPYSLGSILYPICGDEVTKKIQHYVDIVCVFAMGVGMASTLCVGTLSIAGCLQRLFGIESNASTWAVIIIICTVIFTISCISGVLRGIKLLSSLNGWFFIGMVFFVLICGPTAFMLNFGFETYGAFLGDFFRMLFYTGESHAGISEVGTRAADWARGWPVFFWCSWLSWAPITGVFLGRIMKGYTVRNVINLCLVLPAIFQVTWLVLFSGGAVYLQLMGIADLGADLKATGAESVVFAFLEQYPLSAIVVPLYGIMILIAFVTSADSTTNALSGLCSHGLDQNDQEAPAVIKVAWAIAIAATCYIALAYAGGVSGLKATFTLGGFAALFLQIAMVVMIIKVVRNPQKYDAFKEDYDENGKPIPSIQLASTDATVNSWTYILGKLRLASKQ